MSVLDECDTFEIDEAELLADSVPTPEEIARFESCICCILDASRPPLTGEQFAAVEAEWKRRGKTLGDSDVAEFFGLPIIEYQPE